MPSRFVEAPDAFFAAPAPAAATLRDWVAQVGNWSALGDRQAWQNWTGALEATNGSAAAGAGALVNVTRRVATAAAAARAPRGVARALLGAALVALVVRALLARCLVRRYLRRHGYTGAHKPHRD
tara:strand:- start:2429 stop:2803 length:375 start_codon:yes stop_codon:yes gene_type:complete